MQKKQRIPKNTKEQRTKKAKGASAYDEALYFLTPKARTVREVENRLDAIIPKAKSWRQLTGSETTGF